MGEIAIEVRGLRKSFGAKEAVRDGLRDLSAARLLAEDTAGDASGPACAAGRGGRRRAAAG